MTKKIYKKTLLHDEVQSRISKMLIDKNILYKNNPVDNTETNARLIKSFLYRKISSKYPKYNSFSKISTINNLDDNELSNLLLDLPNLDEWYNSIQQSIKNKKLGKKNQSHISDEEEDIDTTANEAVETIDAAVENVNSIIENVNMVLAKVDNIVPKNDEVIENSTKSKTDEKYESNSYENNEMTNDETNQLNENFNFTNTIITVVRKIVIVYAFYKLAKWFI
jgi:hypothetical protein